MIGVGALLQLLSVVGPYCQQRLIDGAYPARNISLMQLLVLATLTAVVASLFLRALQAYGNSLVASDMHRDISIDFYDHVQHLAVGFFESHSSGELANRFQDIRFALRGLTFFIQGIATNAIYLLLVPPLLFSKNATGFVSRDLSLRMIHIRKAGDLISFCF
jgi:ATP-binding cassette subfamily B protein